ncbi:MAG: DUF2330 domain-containing protein [Deltaproteobacteria bacterium]|nr:DUF2330 domain-containing protein [Deltaproteobacteria bacterium]
MKLKLAALALAVGTLTPSVADAFCGFYVSNGDQKMFNDATQVVLMHMNTRTVLSMQNNYKGPPEDFALVIPVPVVLHEGDVKTLDNGVFAHVEAMGAPRLVEYWEQDPCGTGDELSKDERAFPPQAMAADSAAMGSSSSGVTIEAKFTVGEYNILILSAKDSTGLDTWLKQEKYKIPAGAEPLLRPYVESGMKFFVAKVDPKKVKFVPDTGPNQVGSATRRAALSPLRFHYDSDEFALPIRLGLANSSGTQDLIVNILAPQQRYEVANYKNVTIPTNIDVSAAMKDKFAAFYTALFDRTVEKHPGAVVTEYAWQATTCDPCPGPALDQNDFLTLGADVLGGAKGQPTLYSNADFVLTRLHARYGKDSGPGGTMIDDLRFKTAPPIAGGREFLVKPAGTDPWSQDPSNMKLEEGSTPAPENNFQGRYAIRHAWTGPVACDKPIRKRWGGQDGRMAAAPQPAMNLAFAPRGEIKLQSVVQRDVPELDLKSEVTAVIATPNPPPVGSATTPASPRPDIRPKSGCGCQTGSPSDLGGLVMGLGVFVWVRRRRAS